MRFLGFFRAVARRQVPASTTPPREQKFLTQISTGGKHLFGPDQRHPRPVQGSKPDRCFWRLETVSITETVSQVVNTIETDLGEEGRSGSRANVGAAGRVQADPHKTGPDAAQSRFQTRSSSRRKGAGVTIAVQRQGRNRRDLGDGHRNRGIANSDLDRLFRGIPAGLTRGPGAIKREPVWAWLLNQNAWRPCMGAMSRVVSELGKGSVFTLELPLQQQISGGGDADP